MSTFTAARQMTRENVWWTAIEILRAHATIIGIVVAFVISAIAAQYYYHGDSGKKLTLYTEVAGILLFTFTFCVIFCRTVYIMIFVRPDHLTSYIWNDLRTRFLTAQQLTQGCLILLLIYPFMSALTLFKTLIPNIQPFYLDDLFMRMDRALHGGLDPWVLLHPLLSLPFVTFTINIFYNLWFFIFFGVTFWQAFSRKDPALRQQYFMTFLFLWIFLGVICATALSAAGPVYYGRITGLEDPYVPLMTYLYAANESYPIWALGTQDYLWTTYETGTLTAGGGISAMPSLHVAIAVLFALLGWKTNRWLGGVFTLFAAIILVGSVHLGWHYAVDGYVSIVLTCLIWWAVGKWVRDKWMRAQFNRGWLTGRFAVTGQLQTREKL